MVKKMIENCDLPNIKSLGLVWIHTRRTSDEYIPILTLTLTLNSETEVSLKSVI